MFKKKPRLTLGVLQRSIRFIDGFPRWGCFVACILTAIQRSLGRILHAHEIQQWYWQCVEKGFIKHNDLPIKKGCTQWYRCFVVDRVAAFNLAMQMFGGRRRALAVDQQHPANMRIYRWRTRFGVHFTYGSPQRNLHDPDSRLKLFGQDGERDMHVAEQDSEAEQ